MKKKGNTHIISEVDIINPFLQMKKLRHKEVK